MKMCNSEAMKLIKELETKKDKFIYVEDHHSKISYKEGEEKVLTNYDYAQTRKIVAQLDERIRKIKHALAVSNCATVIEYFDITIGEALIYLAQLNAERAQLDELSENVKLSRRITPNGVIEYTECLYDPEQVEKDMEELRAKIGKLQIAIDRANLTHYVDVD